jgi:hypothetical protein
MSLYWSLEARHTLSNCVEAIQHHQVPVDSSRTLALLSPRRVAVTGVTLPLGTRLTRPPATWRLLHLYSIAKLDRHRLTCAFEARPRVTPATHGQHNFKRKTPHQRCDKEKDFKSPIYLPQHHHTALTPPPPPPAPLSPSWATTPLSRVSETRL